MFTDYQLGMRWVCLRVLHAHLEKRTLPFCASPAPRYLDQEPAFPLRTPKPSILSPWSILTPQPCPREPAFYQANKHLPSFPRDNPMYNSLGNPGRAHGSAPRGQPKRAADQERRRAGLAQVLGRHAGQQAVQVKVCSGTRLREAGGGRAARRQQHLCAGAHRQQRRLPRPPPTRVARRLHCPKTPCFYSKGRGRRGRGDQWLVRTLLVSCGSAQTPVTGNPPTRTAHRLQGP